MIMETTGVTRAAVVTAARAWIGTPYRHQASRLGVGCDCLGLVRGVWRTLYGGEPEKPGPYGRDWAMADAEDRLMQAAKRHFGAPIAPNDAGAGDLALFRWRVGRPAQHLGILSDPDHVIHAYEQACVVESPLVAAWRRRMVACFRFPGVID